MPMKVITFRKRRVYSLRFKLHILERIRKGERLSQVAKSLGISHSTVRSIHVNEKKIRNTVRLGCPNFACHVGRYRPKILMKMEIELNNWISDCLKEGNRTDVNSIKRQALCIYKALKEKGEKPTVPEFVASTGWYDGFRRRFLIKRVTVKEENESDIEIVDSSEELHGTVEVNHDSKTVQKEIKKEKPKTMFTSEEFDVAHNNNTSLQLIDNSTMEDDMNQEESEISPNSRSKCLGNVHFIDVHNLDESTFEENQINDNIASFTLKGIKKGLDLAKQLELYISTEDPCHKRSAKFKTELNKCLEPYTKIYNDIKQLKITNFFKKL